MLLLLVQCDIHVPLLSVLPCFFSFISGFFKSRVRLPTAPFLRTNSTVAKSPFPSASHNYVNDQTRFYAQGLLSGTNHWQTNPRQHFQSHCSYEHVNYSYISNLHSIKQQTIKKYVKT